MLLSIESAQDPWLDEIRQMFREYGDELACGFCFAGFEQELAELPGRYGPPAGALLAYRSEASLAACGALRDLGEGVAELKRIFVRPAFRGQGLGRLLSCELIGLARAKGYRTVRLDTLTKLTPAITMYRSLGFVPTQRYNDTPGDDVLFMELDLHG